MTGGEAFWVDHDHDQTNADDGVSRYGAYVRRYADEFAESWGSEDAAARFAATAWRVASGPIMAPPYVRHHPRILSAAVERNHWDGSLTALVDVVTDWPAALETSRAWRGGTMWRDWDTEFGAYVGPTEEQLAAHPSLLASARVSAPLPTAALPTPPAGPYDDAGRAARRAVAALAAELNRIVGPILCALEGR